MDAANKVLVVVSAGQAADYHAALGRRCVDVLTVADVDTGMRTCLTSIAAGIVEEHQITGLQFADAVDSGTDTALPLTGSGVRQVVAQLLVHVHGETGAVKTAGRGTAIHITDTEILPCGIHNATRASRSLRM